jgi:17beta-estradiol 17-dehydrogenase / very-long-chain 3-oxoacyl-CoA reductase
VLISRTQQKLEKTAKEICEKYSPIQVQTIAFDFKNSNVEDYEKVIFSILDNMEIGLLVNNVGMFSDYYDQLHVTPLQMARDVLIVNSVPVTILTSRILSQMTKRNKGIIVNISSSASYRQVIYCNIYSAVKVDFFAFLFDY